MQRLVQQGHLEHVEQGRSGSFRVTQNADPSGGTGAIAQFVELSREDQEPLVELRRQLEASEAG